MPYAKGAPFLTQFVDSSGNPIENGSIEFFLWGTSTPTNVYSDASGTSAGTSVTLDSRGAPQNSGTPIDLYFDVSVVYKIVVKDSAGSPIAPTIGPYYGSGVGGNGVALAIDAVDSAASNSLYDYTGTSNGQQVQVGGYYTVGDGGGGRFYWDNSSSDSDDGGVTILPTGHVGAGRWKRIVKDDITPNEYGCKGDGTTNDTTPFLAMVTYASANNITIKIPQQYTFLLSSSIPAYNGMTIIGSRASERDATARCVIKNTTTDMFALGGSAEFIDDITLIGVTLVGGTANDCFEDTTDGNLGLRYAQIEWCGFNGFASILDTYLTACLVNQCWFDIGNPGASITIRGADWRFTNNYIDWQDATGSDYVVVLTSSSKYVFNGNFITGNNATPLRIIGQRSGSGSRGGVVMYNHIDTEAAGQIDGAGIYVSSVDGLVLSHNRLQRCLGSPAGIFNAAIVISESANVYVGPHDFYNMLSSAASHGLVKVLQVSETVENIYIDPRQVQYDGVQELTPYIESGTVTLADEIYYPILQIENYIRLFGSANTDARLVAVVDGDAATRWQVRCDGRMDWGDGTNPKDTNLYRSGADELRTDDTFRAGSDGAWDGGHLRIGAYHLWVDATGDLRIKSSAPSSDTDGTIVGTQS